MTEFDPHDHRARMKLLERDRDRAVYENRDGVRCPVCDRVFDRVLATEERSRQFTPGSHIEFCVLRGDDDLFVFTHQPAAP
jgi:hypothetical protein